MTRYVYCERVVNKVKKLLAHDERLKDIFTVDPTIQLNSEFYLERIVWTYYEYQLMVYSGGIMLYNRGLRSVISVFNGFDDFLSRQTV